MKLLRNNTSPYARIATVALWEKGYDKLDTQIVDPWGDTPALLEANPAARVPALVLDSGAQLTESLLIVLWLEKTRPDPSLLPGDPAQAVARAGRAMGVIEAAVHTLVGRKIHGGPSFDEAPVGLRRRRTIIDGLTRLEADPPSYSGSVPSLDVITAVVALDYVDFRFPKAPWTPRVERLRALQRASRERPSIAQTLPHD